MQVQSYLFFDGRCEEALEFYRKAVGAQVTMLMRFKESPDPIPADKVPPGSDDKVMHASFNIGETMLMASDGYAKGQPTFKGFALSLNAADEAEAPPAVRCPERGRPGTDAAGQDVLVTGLRHGGGPLRHLVDGAGARADVTPPRGRSRPASLAPTHHATGRHGALPVNSMLHSKGIVHDPCRRRHHRQARPTRADPRGLPRQPTRGAGREGLHRVHRDRRCGGHAGLARHLRRPTPSSSSRSGKPLPTCRPTRGSAHMAAYGAKVKDWTESRLIHVLEPGLRSGPDRNFHIFVN